MMLCYCSLTAVFIIVLYESTESKSILTTFIENNEMERGREAAKVKPFDKKFEKLKSYAGLFTVSKYFQSYMFFWYFPPIIRGLEKNHQTPVIVWLEGVVGKSSMVNALFGNGPIRLLPNNTFIYNKYNWAVHSHLVYFDNPVGAGYSFTLNQGYPQNQNQVAYDLYTALKQFIQLFELSENPLYLAGEGYAGKYISALGVLIDGKNRNNKFVINLKGVAIENGFFDPPNMMSYGKYLHQLGIIDERVRNTFRRIKHNIQDLLKEKKDKEAQQMYSQWMGDSSAKTLFRKFTGLPSPFDVTQLSKNDEEETLLNDFLNQETIKNALNVRKIKFSVCNLSARKALELDTLKSESDDLVFLLNHYNVLLYSGQMNIKYGYSVMIGALKKYKFVGFKTYWRKHPSRWYSGGELAGYFRRGGHLTTVMVRNVGDRISTHQPLWAHQIIANFVQSKSIDDEINV